MLVLVYCAKVITVKSSHVMSSEENLIHSTALFLPFDPQTRVPMPSRISLSRLTVSSQRPTKPPPPAAKDEVKEYEYQGTVRGKEKGGLLSLPGAYIHPQYGKARRGEASRDERSVEGKGKEGEGEGGCYLSKNLRKRRQKTKKKGEKRGSVFPSLHFQREYSHSSQTKSKTKPVSRCFGKMSEVLLPRLISPR